MNRCKNSAVLGQVRKPHHTITDQEIIETLERLKKAGGGEKKLAKVLIPTHLKQELLSELKELRPNLAIKQQ
ncbi:18719_t:CDS:2, partial [Funneliformis geosporum]